jgi:hypothetical protein
MDVVHQLDREWPLLARREISDRLAVWQIEERGLAHFAGLRELLAVLHSAPAAETDEPLLALLGIARHDRLAGRTLLQVLLPALKTQAERIVYPARRRDEVWELLLFHAWQAICCYPLNRRRRVAANLVLQVLHETTRELDRDASRAGHADLAPLLQRQTTSEEEAECVVAAAVSAGVISEYDCELILRSRVDGVRLRLLASVLGVSYTALRKRRQRAEAALRKMLEPARAVPNPAVSDLVLDERRASRRTREAAAIEREAGARLAHAA